MKRLLASVWLLLAVTCCGALLPAANQKPFVEIEFEYRPSWRDQTHIYMARAPDGKIYCHVSTRPAQGADELEKKWKTVKEVSISADEFVRIESGFDAPKLRKAAEQDWIPNSDGSTWRLRRKTGSLTIEVVAYDPDLRAEGAPIAQLARAISDTADVNLSAK